MYKNLLFILLIIFAGITTVIAFNTPTRTINATPPAGNSTAITTDVKARLFQEQNGIAITIEDVLQDVDRTVLILSLSNHQYDLGQDAIYENATLNGQRPVSHVISSNAAGGHHVQAEVSFKKTTSGSFEMTPIEETTFIFTDLW